MEIAASLGAACRFFVGRAALGVNRAMKYIPCWISRSDVLVVSPRTIRAYGRMLPLANARL